MLKVTPEELTERVLKTVTELKQAQKKISHLSIETLRKSIPNLIRDAKQISGTKFVYANFGSDTDSEGLRELASSIASGLESVSAVVVTASVVDGKVALMVATTPTARQEGHSSGRLVKVASVILGGGGGGKDNLAQGGGPSIEKLPQAILAIEDALVK
jgi:alanyl-tRNA synthetase